MKKLLIIILPLMLMFSTTALANKSKQSKYKSMRTDTLRANYKITGIPTIDSDTRYSNITIIEGVAGEVNIVASVTLEGKQVSIEHMRQVNVEMEQHGNRINIETDFNGSLYNISVEINLIITIPSEFIPDMKVNYGNLKARVTALGGSIEAKYSNLDIAQLKEFTDLDIKYSNSRINKAETIELEAAYSNIEIETVNKLNAEYFSYGNLKIGEVVNTIELDDFSYSSFSVNQFSDNISKIIVNAKYSPIEVVLPKGLIVDVNVSACNSDISILGNSKVRNKSDGRAIKIRNLSRGISNHICHVDIESNYGDVIVEQDK